MQIYFKLIQTVLASFVILVFLKSNSFAEPVKLNCQLSDSTVVSAVVYTSKIDMNYPYKQAHMWGGDFKSETETLIPEKVISSIDMLINGKKVFLPLSSYSDLGNPAQIGISAKGNEFKILITGGQTATSYSATIVFNKNGIISKSVNSKEFPEQVWEKSTYSYTRNDGDL